MITAVVLIALALAVLAGVAVARTAPDMERPRRGGQVIVSDRVPPVASRPPPPPPGPGDARRHAWTKP